MADETGTALVPFFLEGVAETREQMLPDGIHPSAAAQPRILDNVWEGLAPLLDGPAEANPIEPDASDIVDRAASGR